MINIEWRKDTLILLDQTKITNRDFLMCTVLIGVKQLRLLRCFAFVGLRAIGVAASYGLILAANGAGRQEIPFSEQFNEFI